MGRNIVLTGLPGSGKSTLGLRMARRFGLDFLDMDTEIEQRAGRPVAEIFAECGEDAFREMETRLAQDLSVRTRTVIATGGGAVLRPENMHALRKNGFVVFLDRPPGHIVRDVDTTNRPLLSSSQHVFTLSEQRRPLYLNSADCRLPVENSPEEALERLCALVRSEYPSGGGFAVIGDPIGHTLSPPIHRAVFEALGLYDAYAPVHVPRGKAAAFVEKARHSGLRGFNVTLPHKHDILPHLDEVDPEAALCGAVNTVVVRNGRLCGYNTDMGGLSEALRAKGYPYKGQSVVILGTGGAARGIALRAAREQAKEITLLGRRRDAVLALCGHIRCIVPGVPCTGYAMTPETLARASTGATLLINATPLGMTGMDGDFPSLSFLSKLPADALVCDLVYNPPETALLHEAGRLGLAVMNGRDMLIFQALLADELFLQKSLDKSRLFQVIDHFLETR